MEPSSERRTTFLDEEEELNDKVGPLHKKNKMPDNLFNDKYMDDMLTSPSVNKMFEERGLSFEGAQGKASNSSHSQPKKQATTKGPTIIPGQAKASQEELAAELKKAESIGNTQLIVSLLETLLSRDLNPKDKVAYQAQKCHLMFKLGRYSEGQETALAILSKYESLPDTVLLNILLVLSKCRLFLDSVDNGYADFLRAQGILWDWEARKVHGEKYEELKDEKDVELWKDSAVDKDILAADELKLMYQLRHQKETDYINTVSVTGGNIQSYLLGLGEPGDEGYGLRDKSIYKILPEFRNRRVLSVACGEHHTLALVEGDIFNLYTPQDLQKKEKGTFGTPDLFGWGENSCGQLTGYETQQNILKPTIIRYFLGKEIQDIHANRASSICYDKQGNVYEWGYRPSGNVAVEVSFSEKKGIIAAKLGNQFSAILTKDERLLIKGEIPGYFNEDRAYHEIQTSVYSIKQIECGNSHILCLNATGEILALGKNNLGQLGIGEDTKGLSKLGKVDVPSYVSPATRVFAFKDASAFVNAEQELYIWGTIGEGKGDAKTRWKPFQYELDFGNGVSRINGAGNQVFVLDTQGKAYLWDLGSSSKFKRYSPNEHESFSEISTGKGFQVLLKSFVEPELCRIQADEEEIPETFKPINFKIKLMDRSGPHYYNSSYPLRYYLFVSPQAQNLEELQQKAASEPLTAAKSKKNQNAMISILAQSDASVQDAVVKPGEEDASVQTLQFVLHKDTTYRMYLFINEQPVKDTPFTFTIGRSPHQEEKEKEEEERLRRELENQKAREEALRQKQAQQQKDLEEKERRTQDTEKRAQEALEKHLQQQKEQQAKMEEERKTRKEAAVGGGFDMSKIKSVSKPSNIDVKNEAKSPTGLPNRTAGRGTTPKTPGTTVTTGTNRGTTPKTPGSTIGSTGSVRGATPKGATPTTTPMTKTGNIPKMTSPATQKPSSSGGMSTSATPTSVTMDKKTPTAGTAYGSIGKKASGTGGFPSKTTKK